MTDTSAADHNRSVFDSALVVEGYEATAGLTDVEQLLFDRHVRPGARVLDLGVGTGRTTPALSALASTYIGIDVAPRMIDAARGAHRGVDLRVGDATDLADIGDASVDVVVFSYNGLDYVLPESRRARCIAEMSRVLVDGGVLIFSTHDPRALVRERNRDLGLRCWPVAWYQSIRRLSRLRSRAFWTGSGVVLDPGWGGLYTYMATPTAVRREVEAHGLRHVSTTSSRYRRRARRFGSEWWYYVFEADAATRRYISTSDAADRSTV